MIAVVAVETAVIVLLLVYILMQRETKPAPPRCQGRRRGPRRFVANRRTDVTGISGTGTVAEGVVFSDGWGVSHWLDRPPMNEPKTEVWHKPWYRRRGTDPFTKISGHGGATVVEWLDE